MCYDRTLTRAKDSTPTSCRHPTISAVKRVPGRSLEALTSYFRMPIHLYGPVRPGSLPVADRSTEASLGLLSLSQCPRVVLGQNVNLADAAAIGLVSVE